MQRLINSQPLLTELILQWPSGSEQQLLEMFAGVLKARKAALWLQDPLGPVGVLQPVFTWGITAEEEPMLSSARLNLHRETLAQSTLQGPFIQVLGSDRRQDMGEVEKALMNGLGLHTLFCSALVLPGDVFGLLYAATDHAVQPDTTQIAQAVQVAQALTTGLHRQRMKQQVEEREWLLSELLSRSPDLFFTFTGDTITRVNSTCFSVLGYLPEEMIGRSFSGFLHPEDVDRSLQARRSISGGVSVQNYINRYLHRDGHDVFLEWNTRLSEDGTIIGTARDVTVRILQEMEIQTSKHFLEKISHTAPTLLFITDLNTQRVLYSNRDLSELMGYTQQELDEMTPAGVFDLVHPEDRQILIQIRERRLHLQDGQLLEAEYRILHKDGDWRWVYARMSIFRRHPDGQPSELITGALDVTARRKMEQQLREAEEALTKSEQHLRELNEAQKRFVADAAHELRTPLAAIQGNIDILFRYPHIPEEEKKDILTDVHHSSARLGRLVQDMLQLARGDAGVLREDEVELHDLVLSAWRDVQRISKEHTFELGSVEEVEMFGDRDRLKQLALILLENATKYTPASGQVFMSLQVKEGCAVFTVKDSGIGISKENQQRIFERFFRVDRTRVDSRDPGGSGLGLPIARWIVDAHRGQILLDSEPGVGSTFTVHLPLLD